MNCYSNLSTIPDNELIHLYGDLLKELKRRNIIRSKNVVGDLGERLAIEFYNNKPGLTKLQAAPKGTRNIDAISRNGERYSIKTTTGNVTGVFYGLPNRDTNEELIKKFEYVILVKLTGDYEIQGIYELTWEQMIKYKKWHSRMKAWNLSLSKELILSSKIIFENK